MPSISPSSCGGDVGYAVSLAVAVKSQQASKQQGQAMIKLLEAVAETQRQTAANLRASTPVVPSAGRLDVTA
ncbi:MAG: hypothetical protein IT442_00740 [Phycisphaeraceae bacterium]|nr:hypothetical protein [Phycisphaeraceae bacterium]